MGAAYNFISYLAASDFRKTAQIKWFIGPPPAGVLFLENGRCVIPEKKS